MTRKKPYLYIANSLDTLPIDKGGAAIFTLRFALLAWVNTIRPHAGCARLRGPVGDEFLFLIG